MAIPVYLQQFKAAGIYRVVFDKSTMVTQNSEILRLVVGYSEQGPFNIPTYVPNVGTFKTLYGDISKKLEKRGVWFHRMAMQALAAGPILALNLKKFETEAVGAVSINTDFNPKFDAISQETVYVEDIYDTSRFWELSAEKLNDMRTTDGSVLDKYINIATTDTEKSSATFFIRKASGSVVANYKVSLNDWYANDTDPLPEYLEDAKSTLVSDYMAEIYVFKGKFTKEQVLSSTSLKRHFTTDDKGELILRKYELDAFGEPVDSLESLYNDENSGALGHYVGSLIPYMKNKKGQYISLDIVFNEDQHIHSMMMSFNTDLLEDDVPANINISGKSHITDKLLDEICKGDAMVSVLGNKNVEVVAESLRYSNNIADSLAENMPFIASGAKIAGCLVIESIDDAETQVHLVQIAKDGTKKDGEKVTIKCEGTEFDEWVKKFENVITLPERGAIDMHNPAKWLGKKVITSIKNLKLVNGDTNVYSTASVNMSTRDFELTVISDPTFGHAGHTHIYNSSLSFILANDNWSKPQNAETKDGHPMSFSYTTTKDNSLLSVVNVGDAVVAKATDVNGNHRQAFITSIDTVSAEEGLYFINAEGNVIDAMTYENLPNEEQEHVMVDNGDGTISSTEEVITNDDWKGNYKPTDYASITFTEEPFIHSDSLTDNSHKPNDAFGYEYWLIRLDGDLCQENGTMYPIFLKGYKYANHKPEGTDMLSKLEWQDKYMLAALTDYKGLRTGLLNKADIDYRYIVDTFETYVDTGVKKVLSFLAKEKQSAFAILNFPAVKTFVKCPYASYVNDKGVFNVQYVVDGYNKKKAHNKGFSLPSDDEGASFCAFYSPLKFSDGYVDSVVPSAALVSNLFMQKYLSRKPYYIVAGPTYGVITAAGLVGPDYNYSKEELNIIEPYGVNCMVYRPNFGTFINANQTAKQTPLSALSRVNVRELVIYLQDEIEKVLQAYQWEFNNANTRNAILSKANTICANIQANGGIQAYKNIMDETNNPPEIIDNEMAILSTHIEPGFGCGKMVHELTIYKTGGLSSAVF